jgi:hypothetical protein
MFMGKSVQARGLLAAGVAVLSLMVPSTAMADKKMPAAQPEPGMALVYFYRPPTVVNSVSKAAFTLDERPFIDLSWGGCTFIQVPPGRHIIGMRWTGLLAPKPGRHVSRGLIPTLLWPEPKAEGPPPDPTLRVANNFAAGQVYLYQLDTWEKASGYREIEYDWRVAPVEPVSGLPTMRECRYVGAKDLNAQAR